METTPAREFLSAWESFYVIVGSSAAALTGLQFVVATLSSEVNVSNESTVRAFSTPTIVHFCAVLFLSATLTAPWHALFSVGATLSLCAIAGVIYACIVYKHTRRQRDYKPVLEDWVWHVILPLAAYTAVFIGGWTLSSHPVSSLFVIGAMAVLLLFVGIHNAWDAINYVGMLRQQKRRKE
jgi:hypothetical protein